MGVGLLIAATALSAGSTVFQSVQAKKAQKSAESRQAAINAKAKKEEQRLLARESRTSEAEARKRALSEGSSPVSPFGITDEVSVGRRKLLGN